MDSCPFITLCDSLGPQPAPWCPHLALLGTAPALAHQAGLVYALAHLIVLSGPQDLQTQLCWTCWRVPLLDKCCLSIYYVLRPAIDFRDIAVVKTKPFQEI